MWNKKHNVWVGSLKGWKKLIFEKRERFLSIWSKVFSSRIKIECKNILKIIKILLITLLANAKLERKFSSMLRVKTGWRNRLAYEQLDHNFRISEEGVSISDHNPNDDIAKLRNWKILREQSCGKIRKNDINYPTVIQQ